MENIPLLYNKFTLRFQYMPFCIVKDALLQCKRASFTPQKGIFRNAKGALLECKRRPIKNERVNSFTKRIIFVLYPRRISILKDSLCALL